MPMTSRSSFCALPLRGPSWNRRKKTGRLNGCLSFFLNYLYNPYTFQPYRGVSEIWFKFYQPAGRQSPLEKGDLGGFVLLVALKSPLPPFVKGGKSGTIGGDFLNEL